MTARALGFWGRSRLPALFARAHQNLYVEVAIDSDLAGKAELSKHAVFDQTILLESPHFRFFACDRNSASRAAGQTATSVAHIDSVLLQCMNEFRALLHLVRAKSFYVDLVRCHAPRLLPSSSGIG